MEMDVLTMEVIEAVEPVFDAEVGIYDSVAEKALTAERCASNLGAVAIVCMGCPMLELCQLKNDALQVVQDQPPIFEMTDELSLANDSTELGYTSKIIEVVTATGSGLEVLNIVQSQPNTTPTPKRPSYREQLFDDTVNFVLTESFLAPNKVILPVVDERQHDVIASPITRQPASGEVVAEPVQEALMPVAASSESLQATSHQIDVKPPTVTAKEIVPVIISPIQPKQIDVDRRPPQQVNKHQVVSAQDKEIPVTTPRKVLPAPIVTEQVVIRSEAEVCTVDTFPLFEMSKPHDTEAVVLDVIFASDESEVVMSHDNDQLVEYIQTIDSGDSVVEEYHFDQDIEAKETILRVIVIVPLIDSDSSDPEIRLSDTVNVRQQPITVLQQLAWRALWAVALKLL